MDVNSRRCKSLVKMSHENGQGLFYSFSETKIKMNSVLRKNRPSIASLSAKGERCSPFFVEQSADLQQVGVFF